MFLSLSLPLPLFLSLSHTHTSTKAHKHTSVASSFPRRLQSQVPPTDLSLSHTHTHTHTHISHTHTLSHLQVIFFTECRSVTEASSNWSHSSKFLKVLKKFQNTEMVSESSSLSKLRKFSNNNVFNF
jgi:hypothetical protein